MDIFLFVKSQWLNYWVWVKRIYAEKSISFQEQFTLTNLVQVSPSNEAITRLSKLPRVWGNFDSVKITIIYKGLLWEKLTKMGKKYQNFQNCSRLFSGPELLFLCRQDRQDEFSTVFTFVYDEKFKLEPNVKNAKNRCEWLSPGAHYNTRKWYSNGFNWFYWKE